MGDQERSARPARTDLRLSRRPTCVSWLLLSRSFDRSRGGSVDGGLRLASRAGSEKCPSGHTAEPCGRQAAGLASARAQRAAPSTPRRGCGPPGPGPSDRYPIEAGSATGSATARATRRRPAGVADRRAERFAGEPIAGAAGQRCTSDQRRGRPELAAQCRERGGRPTTRPVRGAASSADDPTGRRRAPQRGRDPGDDADAKFDGYARSRPTGRTSRASRRRTPRCRRRPDRTPRGAGVGTRQGRGQQAILTACGE